MDNIRKIISSLDDDSVYRISDLKKRFPRQLRIDIQTINRYCRDQIIAGAFKYSPGNGGSWYITGRDFKNYFKHLQEQI